MQREQAVVHLWECGAAEFQHVDLDAVGAEIVRERLDELLRLVAVIERAVEQVGADDAERLLLEDVFLVEHPDVDDDFARLLERRGLEAHAEPAVAVGRPLRALVATVSAKTKNRGAIAALLGEALLEQVVFVPEHGLEPLAGNITRRLAVDRIAERHVVGRHGFGDRTRGASRLEENTGDLLAGADLGDGAIIRSIQIDREGLAVGGKKFLFLAHGMVGGMQIILAGPKV